MEKYFKWRLARFAPLLALVLFVILIGPEKMDRLPAWGRWAIVTYVLLCLAVPVFLGRLWRVGATTSKYGAVIQSHARTVWKFMLFLYIYAFVGGLLAVVIFRRVIPLRYAIIPLGVNLVLILLFGGILFWTASSKSPR